MSDETKKEPATKPVLIVPKGELSEGDLQCLRDNGICCVEALDPSAVRFLEPPPTDAGIMDQAAIKMVKAMLENSDRGVSWSGMVLGDWLARIMNDLARRRVAEPIRKVKRA